MVNNRQLVHRRLSDIIAMPTAHDIGQKQVLVANDETPSNITQIARTVINAGASVELHVHPTMDEHFIFLSGQGELVADDIVYKCGPGVFFLIPAGTPHSIIANTDLEIITIGVAIN